MPVASACRVEHEVRRVESQVGGDERVELRCGRRLLGEYTYPSATSHDYSQEIRLFIATTMRDHEVEVLLALLAEARDFVRVVEAYDTADLLGRIEDALL